METNGDSGERDETKERKEYRTVIYSFRTDFGKR